MSTKLSDIHELIMTLDRILPDIVWGFTISTEVQVVSLKPLERIIEGIYRLGDKNYSFTAKLDYRGGLVFFEQKEGSKEVNHGTK